jgi:hypothetical protein
MEQEKSCCAPAPTNWERVCQTMVDYISYCEKSVTEAMKKETNVFAYIELRANADMLRRIFKRYLECK